MSMDVIVAMAQTIASLSEQLTEAREKAEDFKSLAARLDDQCDTLQTMVLNLRIELGKANDENERLKSKPARKGKR